MVCRVLSVFFSFLGALFVIGSALASGQPTVLAATTVGKLPPSAYGMSTLPDGFLIGAKGRPEVYVVQKGRKSLINGLILDRWLAEAHFIAPDVIIRLSPQDLAAYPDASARNAFYTGKILSFNGQRYFIDDRLRRRPISPQVQAALKYPRRNVYDVPATILNAFPLGPVITRTDRHPGGTVVYTGPYHGGTLYLIRGDDTKHEFLQDYVYETMGFAWSSQILPVTATELARYKRGQHLSTYPDGWIVGKGMRRYLVQGGALRWLASDSLFEAFGYNPTYVLRVFPEFFRNYDPGDPVTAFKNVSVATTEAAVRAAQQAATGKTAAVGSGSVTDSAIAALRVPPESRRLIANVNMFFLRVSDRNPTSNENIFWIDYLYKGEAQTEAEFVAALRTATATGKRPVITSRTAVLSPEKLLRYVNFLFYFVHGRFPTADEKNFWDERVRSGVRKTIEDLGGNIQYRK